MQQQEFLQHRQSIVTLAHLYWQHLGHSLKEKLEGLSSDKKRIAYLAERTVEITNLSEFPRYLTMLFEIDALVLNDDRHLNNIAVIEQDGRYDYCPFLIRARDCCPTHSFRPWTLRRRRSSVICAPGRSARHSIVKCTRLRRFTAGNFRFRVSTKKN